MMDLFLRILGAIGILGALVVFYVLFPLWASKFAKKRGMEGLGKFAFVSIFILLGPLGGLVALLGSANRPSVGEFETECPQCGSKSIKPILMAIDRKTGEELEGMLHVWLFFTLYFAIGAGFINLAIGLYVEFFEWGGLTGPLPGVAFFIIGAAFLWNGISRTRKYYQKDRGKLIVHNCQDCGHTWKVVDDETKAAGISPT
jgi:hypothetical protein